MISGLLDSRTRYFIKYLREFGYEPVISCESKHKPCAGDRLPPGIVTIDSPDLLPFLHYAPDLLNRLGINRWTLNIPDTYVGWAPAAILLSAREAGRRGVDIIYATCSPFTDILIGVALKKMTGKPLVLDLRDPWTFNEYMHMPALTLRANRAMERRALNAADLIVVVSETMRKDYLRLYPDLAPKLAVIPNGYDMGGDIERVSLRARKAGIRCALSAVFTASAGSTSIFSFVRCERISTNMKDAICYSILSGP